MRWKGICSELSARLLENLTLWKN